MPGKRLETEDELRTAVESLGVIAVLGMKDASASDQPAYQIPHMLVERGYTVLPVNPKLSGVDGLRSYANYTEIPAGVQTVNVFRRADFVEAHVDEILGCPREKWPTLVWMQTGIVNEPAAKKLEQAGIHVVMDKCLGVYVSRYGRKA